MQDDEELEDEDQDEQETGEKPQKAQTPFQRACGHLFVADAAEKQVEEQIIRELVEYLEENYVTVPSPVALALADIMALEEAEVNAHDFTYYHSIKEYLSDLLQLSLDALQYQNRVASELLRVIPGQTYHLDYNIISPDKKEIEINILEQVYQFVLEVWDYGQAPIQLDDTIPLNIKNLMDMINNNVHATIKEFIKKLQETRRILEKISSDYSRSSPNYISDIKLRKQPSDLGMELTPMVQNFQKWLEYATTYSVIQREIERTKFLLPGYWDAYQKIKAWSDKLATMEYNRRLIGFRDANRPHEWDNWYARADGKFHAVEILKSLSEDILSGTFASPPQPEEVEEDSITTAENKTSEV